MIYRILFPIALLLSTVLTQAQKPYNCNLLKSALEYQDFDRQFHMFDSMPSANIIITDTSRYFENCQLVVNNKKINFSYDLPHSPNRKADDGSKGKIVILDITRNRNVYRIRFWAPYSNATLGLKMIQQKGKFKVVTESRGTF